MSTNNKIKLLWLSSLLWVIFCVLNSGSVLLGPFAINWWFYTKMFSEEQILCWRCNPRMLVASTHSDEHLLRWTPVYYGCLPLVWQLFLNAFPCVATSGHQGNRPALVRIPISTACQAEPPPIKTLMCFSPGYCGISSHKYIYINSSNYSDSSKIL